MGNNFRIVILNKSSALVTERYGVQFFAPIQATYKWNAGIELGKKRLRVQIAEYRATMREGKEKHIRLEPGHFIREMVRRRESLILEEKTPKTAQRHVGVEIEFVSSYEQKSIRRALTAAGLAAYCNLTTDGSVSGNGSDDCDGSCRDNCECSHVETFHCDTESQCNSYNRYTGQGEPWVSAEDCEDCERETDDSCDCGGVETLDDGSIITRCDGHIACAGHCPGHTYDPDADCNCECTCSGSGHELRVIAPQCEIKGVIERVCRVLNNECYASINKTCGLHVHLDMRRRNHLKAFNNLVRCQPLLYGIVPQSRRRNTYCQPTDKACFKSMQGTGRYKGINPESFREHQTIEVRIHSGTTSAAKINHWIDLLVRIATARTIATEVATIAELKKQCHVPGALVEYLKKRLEKFTGDKARYYEEVA